MTTYFKMSLNKIFFMKSLKNFEVQELTIAEMSEINGGSFFGDLLRGYKWAGETLWKYYGDDIKEGFNDFWSFP